MRKIKLSDRIIDGSYRKDCERIVSVFAEDDIECTLEQAYLFWEMRSYDWCAGWLGLPDSDEELKKVIEEYRQRGYYEVEEE